MCIPELSRISDSQRDDRLKVDVCFYMFLLYFIGGSLRGRRT